MSRRKLRASAVLHKAHSKSKSLRITVPKPIIDAFELKEGDILEWTVENLRGKKVLIARRMIVG